MKTISLRVYFHILLAVTLLALSSSVFALLPFSKTGNLYVSMWNANEIAIFSPDGTPLESFTANDLDGPRGIAFSPANGENWVASKRTNAIFIFDHEHQFLRTLEHEDFDEPVGVTLRTVDQNAADALVYISNSDDNEIMVCDQNGTLKRSFTAPYFADPNCSAFMTDGSLMIANRLGGSSGATGSTSKFDTQENFRFDFTAPDISSQMAMARDPNIVTMDADDTLG